MLKSNGHQAFFKEWEKFLNRVWEKMKMNFKKCNSDSEPGLTWEEVAACDLNYGTKADFDKLDLNEDETLDLEELEKFLEMNSV